MVDPRLAPLAAALAKSSFYPYRSGVDYGAGRPIEWEYLHEQERASLLADAAAILAALPPDWCGHNPESLMVLGHPIEDVIRWKAEHDLRIDGCGHIGVTERERIMREVVKYIAHHNHEPGKNCVSAFCAAGLHAAVLRIIEEKVR